jgi:hypothetical protein
MNGILEYGFSCPNCEESLNWLVPIGALNILESGCPVCRAPLTLNQVTNSVEIRLIGRTRAFVGCGIWDVDKRVINYFRGFYLKKGTYETRRVS